MTDLFIILLAVSFLVILITFIWELILKKTEAAVENNTHILAHYIGQGVMAFIRRQCLVVLVLTIPLITLIIIKSFLGYHNFLFPIIVLSGLITSMIAGYFGLYLSNRGAIQIKHLNTTVSSQKGYKRGLQYGAMVGIYTTGFLIADLSGLYLILNYAINRNLWNLSHPILHKMQIALWQPDIVYMPQFQIFKQDEILIMLFGYALGALVHTLFTRISAGIFSNAATIASDTIGTADIDLPENDLRNPASIARHISIPISNIFGSSTDLFSCVSLSLLTTALLGSTLVQHIPYEESLKHILLPFMITGIGFLVSFFGIIALQLMPKMATKTSLRLTRASLTGILLGIYITLLKFHWLSKDLTAILLLSTAASWLLFEYYLFLSNTTHLEKPHMGTLNNLINGLMLGGIGFILPFSIGAGLLLSSFTLAHGYTHLVFGFYGITLSAVSLLSLMTFDLSLVTVASMSENAYGFSEMLNEPDTNKKTYRHFQMINNSIRGYFKSLLGTKNLLLSFGLLMVFWLSLKFWLYKALTMGLLHLKHLPWMPQNLSDDATHHILYGHGYLNFIEYLNIQELIDLFHLNLINPQLWGGLLIGLFTISFFCALILWGIEKSTAAMITETREQYKIEPNLWEGKILPKYEKSIHVGLVSAQKTMGYPILLAILLPILTGIFLGIAGITGLLISIALITFLMTICCGLTHLIWKNRRLIDNQSNPSEAEQRTHIISEQLGHVFNEALVPSINVLNSIIIVTAILFGLVIIKLGIALF